MMLFKRRPWQTRRSTNGILNLPMMSQNSCGKMLSKESKLQKATRAATGSGVIDVYLSSQLQKYSWIKDLPINSEIELGSNESIKNPKTTESSRSANKKEGCADLIWNLDSQFKLILDVLQVLFRLNSLDFETIPHSRGTRRNVSSLKFLKKIWKSLLPVVRICLICHLVDQNLIVWDVGSGPVGLCVKAGIGLGQIMFCIYTRVVNQLTRLRTMSNCYTNQLAFEWHVKKPVHWPKIEKLRENW